MQAVDVHGRFVWHQLFTRDVESARSFYPTLTGWRSQAWAADPAQSLFLSGAVPTAGVAAMGVEFPAQVPPHWLPYVGTRDVDGTVRLAQQAGGTVIRPPSDLPSAGRYAVLADPQGAVFAVLTPERVRPEPVGLAPQGQFSWHELGTTDHEAAFAFYARVFGWEALRRLDLGPIGVYLIFGVGGQERGGMYVVPADRAAPPSWLCYAHVDSVDDTMPKIEVGGGRLLQPPMDVPGGSRILVLQDPTGAAFALQSLAVAVAPRPARRVRRAVKAKARTKSRAVTRPRKTRKKPTAKSSVRSRLNSRGRASRKPGPRKKVARRKK